MTSSGVIDKQLLECSQYALQSRRQPVGASILALVHAGGAVFCLGSLCEINSYSGILERARLPPSRCFVMYPKRHSPMALAPRPFERSAVLKRHPNKTCVLCKAAALQAFGFPCYIAFGGGDQQASSDTGYVVRGACSSLMGVQAAHVNSTVTRPSVVTASCNPNQSLLGSFSTYFIHRLGCSPDWRACALNG